MAGLVRRCCGVRLPHAATAAVRSWRGVVPSSRRSTHDVGGDLSLLSAPVDTSEHALLPWELECHALFVCLSKDGVLRTDELRRKIEQLPTRSHEDWTYYERWSAAIAGLLQEKGVLAPGELEAAVWGGSFGKPAGADMVTEPRFAPGDAVVVRQEDPSRSAWRAPHLRTPGYIFGITGTVERYCGAFGDPSLLAYGIGHGPKDHLYRVRFRQSDVWPEATAPIGHAIHHTSDLNLPADSVDVEIYESWLLPSSFATTTAAEVPHASLRGLHSGAGSSETGSTGHHDHDHEDPHSDELHHHHQHDHDHHEDPHHDELHNHHDEHNHHNEPNQRSTSHEHKTSSADRSPTAPHAPSSSAVAHAPSSSPVAHAHDHAHLSRPELECASVRSEGAPRPGAAVHHALLHLLTHKKKLLTIDRLVSTVEAIELSGRRMLGSTLVARAWVDAAFKARLLHDASAAAAEMGISTTNPNAPTQLTVVANDAKTHNLVVCTLCSCYPAALLGPSPAWYKSRSYRARAVRAPRALLREAFGLRLPSGVALRVHDSSADLRYLVLPERPEGTEGMGEAELAKRVGRDAMIGVARG